METVPVYETSVAHDVVQDLFPRRHTHIGAYRVPCALETLRVARATFAESCRAAPRVDTDVERLTTWPLAEEALLIHTWLIHADQRPSISQTHHAVPQEASPSLAYTCGEELSQWLSVSIVDLTDALGLSRATYYSWKNRSAPRQGTTRQLYKVHALVRLVVDALSERGAQGWLNIGTPSWRERILAAANDRSALEDLLDEVRRTFAPVVPQTADRTPAVQVSGMSTRVPDPTPEGW